MERIESNKILEDSDDDGAIHLLINIECTVILIYNISPIRNTPRPTSIYKEGMVLLIPIQNMYPTTKYIYDVSIDLGNRKYHFCEILILGSYNHH